MQKFRLNFISFHFFDTRLQRKLTNTAVKDFNYADLLSFWILVQVANDGPGSQILEELRSDGVDVSNVVVRHGPE